MEDAKEVLTKIAQTNESKVPEDIEVKLHYSIDAVGLSQIFFPTQNL